MERRRRGRPRAYDPDVAMAKAMGAFWDKGYAATSLDDLSAATGMNRPSLYTAFGDKQAIYLKAMQFYGADGALKAALAHDEPLREALRRTYQTALSVYLSGEQGARGCFVIGTAATEAVTNPEVRARLAAVLHGVDEGYAARVRRAQRDGELPENADPVLLGKIASAALFSLAIRARAGESRAELEKTVDAAIAMICGPTPPLAAVPRRGRRAPRRT